MSCAFFPLLNRWEGLNPQLELSESVYSLSSLCHGWAGPTPMRVSACSRTAKGTPPDSPLVYRFEFLVLEFRPGGLF